MKYLFLLCLTVCAVGCGGGGGGNANAPQNQAPSIQADDAVRVDANSSNSTTITIDDDLTALSDLIVETSADNGDLFPMGSITVSGTEAMRTISLTPAVDEVGSSRLSVRVMDAGGLSVSATINIDVDPIARNASAFSRDLAMRDELGDPVLINAIDIFDDAVDDDFSDLLVE
ncbi:MAG: hypothetical protein AAF542_24595 [Pseudomonadota bacterium]